MDVAVESSNETEQIRALVDGWARAVREKDVDRVLARYDADVVVFDCHSQMQTVGIDPLAAQLRGCCAQMRGPMTFDVHDLRITAGDTVGFGHFLAHCGGTGVDGGDHFVWLRVTIGLRKAAGVWSITHAHSSAPFESETGRAIFDQPPDR